MSKASIVRQLSVVDTTELLTSPAPDRSLEEQVRALYENQGLTVDTRVLGQALALEASAQPCSVAPPRFGTTRPRWCAPLFLATLLLGLLVTVLVHKVNATAVQNPALSLIKVDPPFMLSPTANDRVVAMGRQLAKHAHVRFNMDAKGTLLVLTQLNQADCQALDSAVPLQPGEEAERRPGLEIFINGAGRPRVNSEEKSGADMCDLSDNSIVLSRANLTGWYPDAPPAHMIVAKVSP